MRVLLINPTFGPPGGGGTVAAFALQALAARHDVTTLSLIPVDIDEINRYYGTRLVPGTFRTRVVPWRARALWRLLPTRAALLALRLLLRYARREAGAFDRVVGMCNEIDTGGEAIQYVHYPSLKYPRPEAERRWYHLSPLLGLYYAGCEALAPISQAAIRRNLTLTNSQWTAGVIHEVHALDAQVLYPPVPGPFAGKPWAEREDGFVIVGRVTPEKRIDLAIDIVAALRERGFPVRLHVVGSAPRGRWYPRPLAARLAATPFVTWHRDLGRADLLALVGSQRYALHAMKDEHFGIAVAEEVQSGCIPFVHNSGGQVEIVNLEPALTWNGVDEAVAKIAAVLVDPARQAALRDGLRTRRDTLTADRFMTDLLAAVESAGAAPAPEPASPRP